MSSFFKRKKESFVCQVCGKRVEGNGYTDHCPFCLWSKHLDLFPGDRKAGCGGLMEPIALGKKKGKWRILYRCQQCGYQRWNKIAPADSLEVFFSSLKKGKI